MAQGNKTVCSPKTGRATEFMTVVLPCAITYKMIEP